MADLGPVAWPPEPIRTGRLVLREPEARDRAAVIELLTSPEVGTYLGGPSRAARWAAAGWSAWGQDRASSAYGRETSNACRWPK